MSVVYGKFLYESIRVIQEIISPNSKLQHLQEILFSKLAYDVPNERKSIEIVFNNIMKRNKKS